MGVLLKEESRQESVADRASLSDPTACTALSYPCLNALACVLDHLL